MKYDITETLVNLAGNVSHDPEEEDWFEVDEFIEAIPNTAPVLKDLLVYLHKEFL